FAIAMADRARPIHHLLAMVGTRAAFRRVSGQHRIHAAVLIADARVLLSYHHRRDPVVGADLTSDYRALWPPPLIHLYRSLDAADARVATDSGTGGLRSGRRDDVWRQRRSDTAPDSGSVGHEALRRADGNLRHFRYARLCRWSGRHWPNFRSDRQLCGGIVD